MTFARGSAGQRHVRERLAGDGRSGPDAELSASRAAAPCREDGCLGRGRGRQQDEPVLGALATVDVDEHAGAVDVAQFQGESFLGSSGF
jgi:hypothetical protein